MYTELPDPIKEPKLFELVETRMIHSPCGYLNPSCPCMKDNLCTKSYPKLPREETAVNLNGYPAYRRREASPPVTVKKGRLGVGSVVPYNPCLLELFECHLNVEVCTSIKAIRYLYKSTYKGPDKACLERVVDEVANFIDSRCGRS